MYVPSVITFSQPIVLIHGGWWKAKTTNEQTAALAEDLAKRGFLVINLEFRRVGNGGGWPMTFFDVCSGVDLLAAISLEHAVDSRNAIVIGYSSGGHLALLLRARSTVEVPEAAILQPSKVSFGLVVSLAGIADLRLAQELDLGPTAVRNFIGGEFNDAREEFKKADPMTYASHESRTLLVHGESDVHVPLAISQSYLATAQSNDVNLLTFPNADHFTLLDPSTTEWSAVVERIVSE